MELLTLILCILVCVYLDYSAKYRWLRLPGPWFYVPYLGHLELLLNLGNPVKNILSLYNKYNQGGVCYTSLINQNNLLVGDYNTLKFLFNHPHVQNRVTSHTGNLYKYLSENRGNSGPILGVMHSQGQLWKEQRRFTIRTLRDFGFGKRSMDELVKDEFKKFTQHIDKLLATGIPMVNMEIIHLMKELINNHLKTLDVEQPRDFIDSYLIEIAGTTSPNSSFYGANGYENLAATLTDLFQAGSETTATTLRWAVLYLVLYPEVQQRIQVELDRVLEDRDIELGDKEDLPYSQAVILEIQRLANILPHGGNHKTNMDVEVNGFVIPADTFITPVYAAILQGSHWIEGEKFNPDRFLDNTGNLRKDEHLIPFSIGKRQCLGESLAKAQLFIFITGLVRNYNLLVNPDTGAPLEHEYIPGFTISPKPFSIILQRRVKNQ
ncbi:cytochrome P450 2J6 [Eurytemora carolleeae]|uniref:cytochrome P450 2J6 n=1 Tax=Eurytemora carolleeae TaxID=1294199 RepID=UPI000C7868B2|nr:cytochrome P450 2J6 [Eurytemora carolleeae]|eukprot:XP_023320166.1 cytochrome P450 2J6-like [Eurytemora affinis]